MYDFKHPVKCTECVPLDKGELYTCACIQIYMHIYVCIIYIYMHMITCLGREIFLNCPSPHLSFHGNKGDTHHHSTPGA